MIIKLDDMTRKNVYEIPECELLELKLEYGLLDGAVSAETVRVVNSEWDAD